MAPARKSRQKKALSGSESGVAKEEPDVKKVKEEPVLKEEPVVKEEPVDFTPSMAKKCPSSWERVYDNILKMREDRDAPVDNMGCEKSPL